MEANVDVIAAAEAQYEKRIVWEENGLLNDKRSPEAIAAYEKEYVSNAVHDLLASMNIN